MLLKSSVLRLVSALFIAAMLPTAPAAANDDGPITYRVKEGDTLYNIGRRFLISDRAVREVQRINRIRNPRRIPLNKQLRIPRNLLDYKVVEVKVDKWAGNVTIGNRQVAKNTPLLAGQTVTTRRNGFVSFSAPGGARFTMPSNSTMRLVRAKRYILGNILDVEFEIVNGRGTINSPKLKDQERLRTKTKVATTAVRGTVFRVGYLEEEARSLTEVVEGSVNVAVGQEASLTAAGFGVASTAAGVGEQEELLPKTSFIDGTKTQTAQTLNFAIDPIAGAEAYRVQIARDASFHDVITETITPTNTVSFASIDDKRYHVRARAISASGIEGNNSAANSFRRKRLGVSPDKSTRSELLDGYVFNWNAEGSGKTIYAFQLWPKGNPGNLVVDETGLAETSLLLTNLDPGSYEWRVAVMQAEPIEDVKAEEGLDVVAAPPNGLLKVWAEPMDLVVGE